MQRTCIVHISKKGIFERDDNGSCIMEDKPIECF